MNSANCGTNITDGNQNIDDLQEQINEECSDDFQYIVRETVESLRNSGDFFDVIQKCRKYKIGVTAEHVEIVEKLWSSIPPYNRARLYDIIRFLYGQDGERDITEETAKVSLEELKRTSKSVHLPIDIDIQNLIEFVICHGERKLSQGSKKR
jgi:hypothetical protein